MCRLSAFIGAPICAADLVTRPSRSIITQSFDARERLSGDASTPGYLNGDGFGLGWYSQDPNDPEPCVYRQARPAWNDGNLTMIAAKIISPLLFAHVRAASPGMDVSQTTCHPFHFGRYLWMHNGGVGGFNAVRRILLPTLKDDAFDFAVTNGSSDSALCFAVFLNLVPDKSVASTPDEIRDRLDVTICIIRRAILEAGVDVLSLLNFVVSDGQSLVASRVAVHPSNPNAPAASLYYASGNNYVSDPDSNDYHMVHVDRRSTMAMVSSEPLTEHRSDWLAVPKNHILVVTPSLHILRYELDCNIPVISRLLQNLQIGDTGTLRRPESSRGSSHFVGDPTYRAGRVLRSSDADGSENTVAVKKASFPSSPYSDGVFQRAVSSQTLSAKGGVKGARKPLPEATLSPGPVSSSLRYEITTTEHAILAMVVCGPYLCCGAQDGSIRVWHIENRREVSVLQKHSGAVLVMTCSEDGSVLISGTSKAEICIWKILPSDKFVCARTISCAGNGAICSLSLVKGTLYTGFSDTLVRSLNESIDSVLSTWMDKQSAKENDSEDVIRTSTLVPEFPKALSRASSVTAGEVEDAVCYTCVGTSKGLQAMTSHEADLELASSESRHSKHFGCVLSLTSCKGDDLMCSGCADGLIRVWDVESGTWVRSLEGHAGAVLAMVSTVVNGATTLFSGSRDRTVRVWDADSGFLCKRTIRKHKAEVVSCDASADVVLTGSADGQVYIWCSRTLHCIGQYRCSSLQAATICVPNGFVFLATDDSKIQVRDLVHIDKKGNKTPMLGRGNCTESTLNAQGQSGAEVGHLKLAATHVNRLSDAESLSRSSSVEDVGETLVPGLPNEVVLAPPSSPLVEGVVSAMNLQLPAIGIELGASVSAGAQRNAGLLSPEMQVSAEYIRRVERRVMQDVLARFVSIQTVSRNQESREECWQGAKYLSIFLEGLGAHVKLLRSENAPQSSHNPIVFAKFSSTAENAKTLVFYGHYDVMPAESKDWDTNPWELTAVDEHVYGRGATDNKGPIVAMIFAIKSLLENNRDGLGINVVLLLEGEGENSNDGFRDVLSKHKDLFGETSMILTSNSNWLGEERPCLTYGMRGLIELEVRVSGGSRNLHSGVDGGAIYEPVSDLLGILGSLTDTHGMALIPTFYDNVRPLSDEDEAHLEAVQFELTEYRARTGVAKFTSSSSTELLQARWRHPSISVTSLETSNKARVFSVMPREASAKLSIRFVADQKPEELTAAIKAHLQLEFAKRRSKNSLAVTCAGTGDWWMEDPTSFEFRLAASAIKKVWDVEPLYVCEGGTMSIFSFMSRTLNAPVVQVPLGQASDGAHLPNERIRAMNLFQGKVVLQHIVHEMNRNHTNGLTA